MSDVVHWVLELSIKPIDLDTFRSVMTDLVSAAEQESGTVAFEWHFNDDGTICHVYERFRDSAAAAAHLEMFGTMFAERFLAVGKPTRLCLFGDPDQGVLDILRGFSPLVLKKVAGFSRLAA